MIFDFIRQTNASIVDFLVRMYKRTRTYSAHAVGIDPFDAGTHLYFFATKREMVVVLIDCLDKPCDELACEERVNDQPPQYFTADSSRRSPVFLLKLLMEEISIDLTFRFGKEKPRLHGIVVSNSHFINRGDMFGTWGDMGVSVFDRQEDINHLLYLRTNGKEQLPGAAYVQPYKNCFVESEGIFDEEFEQMLEDFINREYDEMTNTDGNTAGDDAEQPLPPADDEEEEPETADGFDSYFDDMQMNPNNSVPVEVLRPMNHPEREMERLVGCQNIKRHIQELIVLNEYNKRLRLINPKARQHELSLHSIFLGQPGTGKTTVCKVMGSLLYQAGMLSKGHVVVANRGTFVGSNWGDEERAVRLVLEKAQGGVLMIDEAYLLNGDSRNDPGKMVLPLLMDILANEHKRDLAIVLCGYKQPMLRLLELNPGLESRFPNRFEFEDFTIDELLDISQRRVGEYNYTFTPQAWETYRSIIANAYQMRDPETWGNARFVANQLERIYLSHAQRCISSDINDRDQLFTITPADIQPIEVPRQRARIGF